MLIIKVVLEKVSESDVVLMGSVGGLEWVNVYFNLEFGILVFW